MSLLGLDLGTTGCKATIINNKGDVLKSAYREYLTENAGQGREELNPEIVWELTKEVIREVINDYQGYKIRAISISSFGEAVIPVDQTGKALANSILYIDNRGLEELKLLKNKLGNERVLQITGASIHPMYSLSKIMWLKNNKPEVYNKTWKFMMFADYILFKLGAEPFTDYSLAARSLIFDIIQKEWSAEILDCVGIDRKKLNTPVQSGTKVGRISRDIAKELGLTKEVVLVAGGHDQACAALGAGIVKSGIAVDGMGTVECITPALDKPYISSEMAASNLVCVPHVLKDMYITYAFNFTGGSLLKWFRDNFAYEERQLAQADKRDVYEILIAKAVKYPTDLFILPHFAGAATPYMDPDSRGAVIGMTLETTKAEIIKAILEGVTYEMMVNLACLNKAGINLKELRAVGGGAKSDYWLQLKADMMGKKIVSLNVSEAGTLGVAMLAGTAIGVYSSLTEAVQKLVRIKKEYYPDKEIHEQYQQKFEIYKKIYPQIKSILAEKR